MYLIIGTTEVVRRERPRVAESPSYGRFLQADPIGYWDNPNLYAYVGNDPVNFVDPLGLDRVIVIRDKCPGGYSCPAPYVADPHGQVTSPDVVVTGNKLRKPKSNPQSEQAQCPRVNPGSMGTMTEAQVAMTRPGWQTINAFRSSRISLAEAEANFPGSQLHNGPGDAWRHFRWNFAMAQSMGRRPAAAYANAHELSNPNDAAEHAMDMYNNAMGRAFASAYPNLSPNEAANLALRSGCLQTAK